MKLIDNPYYKALIVSHPHAMTGVFVVLMADFTSDWSRLDYIVFETEGEKEREKRRRRKAISIGKKCTMYAAASLKASTSITVTYYSSEISTLASRLYVIRCQTKYWFLLITNLIKDTLLCVSSIHSDWDRSLVHSQAACGVLYAQKVPLLLPNFVTCVIL